VGTVQNFIVQAAGIYIYHIPVGKFEAQVNLSTTNHCGACCVLCGDMSVDVRGKREI